MRDKSGPALVGNVRTQTQILRNIYIVGAKRSREMCGNDTGSKGHADLHSSLSATVRGGWKGRGNKRSE